MKRSIITLQLFLLFAAAFSQSAKFEYFGRWNPTIKKEKLTEAKFLTDVCDNFWNKLDLYKGDKKELERQKSRDCSQRYFYHCKESRFSNVIDFERIEISTDKNGKTIT